MKHKGKASVEWSGEKTELKKGTDIEFKDNLRTGTGGVVITCVADRSGTAW